MNLGLDNNSVLVTGGSKGIGLSIARIFANEGARVTIAGRNEADLATAEATILADGNTATAITADLATDHERQRLFDQLGDIDILVNNAGAIKGGGIADLSMQDWRDGWDLKVYGYIHLCKLFVEAMKARRKGAIINIIGLGGRHTTPGYICGAAGNAALIGFTQALGAETPDYNVRVFGINPSPTLTTRMIDMLKGRAERELGDVTKWEEFLDPTRYPFGRMQTPDEIGSLAVMLASDRVQYLSGTVVDSSGGGQWK